MTDPLAEVMRGLRRDYLKGAPQRLDEISALLRSLENGDAASLDQLRRALHKLAGSGGSYGFDEISKTARAGEHLAKALLDKGGAPAEADVAELARHVGNLIVATQAAIAANPDAG